MKLRVPRRGPARRRGVIRGEPVRRRRSWWFRLPIPTPSGRPGRRL